MRTSARRTERGRTKTEGIGRRALRLGSRQAQTTAVELGERERAILDLERDWWRDGERKETVIRRRLELSSSRYYRLLHGLLDSPAALAYDPLVVHRLLRARRARLRVKVEGPRVSSPPRR